MSKKIIGDAVLPVLLAGGSGKRLWPLSRRSYPKQFSNLVGTSSLFQKTVKRLVSSDLVDFLPPTVVTNSDFRFIVREQLQDIDIDSAHILIEPEAKNTAPAILAASIHAYLNNPEAILLVAPSDHIIPDEYAFHVAVKTGLKHVFSGKLVTFGVSPLYPETGYGYLEIQEEKLDEEGSSAVKRFIEKPRLEQAKQMLNSGNYFWNAGIFLFRAADMISAFENFLPDTLKATKEAIENAKIDLDFLRINSEAWENTENISIDYAIMEKALNLVVVPFLEEWSDLGSWDTVWSTLDKDRFGVVTSANAHAIECSKSLLRSENSAQELVGLGLENIIAIAMPDAVLVADRSKSQNVKNAVDLLSLKSIKQAEVFPKDHRPWGWFESLTVGERFQVKRICVKPGASLSLQSHSYRSEHWIVVEGNAKVTVDEEVKCLAEGQSIFVPKGAIHRLENTGKALMVLIEVQVGSYLGEDDIVRYEDLYARQ